MCYGPVLRVNKEWWDSYVLHLSGGRTIQYIYSTFPKLSFLFNSWNIFLINLPSSSYHLLFLLPSIAGIVAYPLLTGIGLDVLWQGNLDVRFSLGSCCFLFLSQTIKGGSLNCVTSLLLSGVRLIVPLCFSTHTGIFHVHWSLLFWESHSSWGVK